MKISFRAESKRDVLLHLGIVFAVFILIILSFFYLYLPFTTNHGQTVTVPDLKGMTLEQVEDYLSERDLEYIVDDSTYDPKAQPLTVYTQDPASGATVKQGRKIFLTINAKNPPLVKMPKLINRSFVNAQGELESYGLQLGKAEYRPDIQVNMVLEQRYNGQLIAEGTPVPKGAKIDLVIGDGVGKQEFDMPSLVGMPFEEIQSTLAGNGLQIGSILYVNQPDSTQNVVVKHKPAAATKVRVGDAVDIWIRGQDPSTSTPSND